MSAKPKAAAVAALTPAQTAALNFFQFQIRAGKKIMTHVLPKEVQKQIIKKLAEDGQPVDGARFVIDLFGPYQEDYKKACIAPAAAVRTHADAVTFAKAEKSPVRLIRVIRAPMFEIESDKLIARAKAAKASFMPHFEEYAEAGRKAADHNFPFTVQHRGRTCRVSEILPYPTKQELDDALYLERTPFEPLPVFDAERFVNLPAEFVAKYAKLHDEARDTEMQQVKAQAIEDIKKIMKLLSDQLGKGEKLYETLKDKAQRAAEQLSDLADGYDADPMIKALAKTIQERIADPTNKDWSGFKETPSAKADAARAAHAVHTKLQQITKAAAPVKAQPRPAVKSAAKKGRAAVGGLARKIAAKNAKK